MTRRRIIVHASLALVAWFTVLLVLSPPRHGCDPTRESAAIGSLRSFASAQRDYFDRTGRYGTLRELAFSGDIDESLLCSRVRNGYRFDVELMAGGKDFAVQACHW